MFLKIIFSTWSGFISQWRNGLILNIKKLAKQQADDTFVFGQKHFFTEISTFCCQKV